MSRSGHSGTEPWEYPPDAPMGIKSIGELVFELISPLSWSGSMLVRCKWTLYSPRGAKCAHISQQSQGVLSVRPSRCTSREPLRTIRCYRLHVSALEMSLTPGTARPRQYHDSREHSACRCFLGRACNCTKTQRTCAFFSARTVGDASERLIYLHCSNCALRHTCDAFEAS